MPDATRSGRRQRGASHEAIRYGLEHHKLRGTIVTWVQQDGDGYLVTLQTGVNVVFTKAQTEAFVMGLAAGWSREERSLKEQRDAERGGPPCLDDGREAQMMLAEDAMNAMVKAIADMASDLHAAVAEAMAALR